MFAQDDKELIGWRCVRLIRRHDGSRASIRSSQVFSVHSAAVEWQRLAHLAHATELYAIEGVYGDAA